MMELVADTFNLVPVAEKKAAGAWPTPALSTQYVANLIRSGPSRIVGLEIGTLGGESAYWLLENCSNIVKLYTVDPYVEYTEWIGVVRQDELDAFKRVAQINLAEFGDRVEMVERAPRIKYDFAFIDGAHDYASVMHDFESYYGLVKRGGVFCGHDYNLCPGVRRAVEDFRNARQIKSPLKALSHDIFYWVV